MTYDKALGFQAIAGESKIRLVSSWPADALPPPTASLLSIASRTGLLAAAGPESVIIASTQSVRDAFSAPGLADGHIKPFNPQLKLGVRMRVSQVAFTADESHLVISAENEGGLAIYSVESLKKGSTQVEFEISTDRIPLRAMVPNPAPGKAELIAIVTADGKLLVANLQTRTYASGKQGPILREGISCVSWSTRGKQLVAGCGSGACLQMTPEGEPKADIPRPGSIEADQHGKRDHQVFTSRLYADWILVLSISWLENDIFLTAHTSSLADPNAPVSIKFHLISRNPQAPTSFLFQKLPEVCSSFGSNRLPPFCSMQRLKDFPPNIQDLIIVVSTASADVGLFTRAKAPLSNEFDMQKVTNTFTATSIADDARRASLPIQTSGEGADTSSIGVALDLSSNEKVKRPLPQEEYDETSGPLPGLMVLNEEGILSSWWVVYADSIRQNTAYPGLVNETGQQSQLSVPRQESSFARIDSTSTPFNQSPFGGNAAGSGPGIGMSKPAAPGFGVSASGTSLGPGKSQSPWGAGLTASLAPQNSTTAFGQTAFGVPAFGLPSTVQGPAFGTSGGIGNRVSPWSTQSVGSASASGSVFGQTGGLGSGALRGSGAVPVFGANTGGFATFANGPGFAEAAAQGGGGGGGGGSVLGKPNPDASLDSGMETDNSLTETPKKPAETSAGLLNGGAFKLGSTFKGDGTAANDFPKPSINTSSSLFDNGFVQSLEETEKILPTSTTQEAQMNDSMSDYGSRNPSPVERESMSPVIQPTAPESQFPSATLPTNGGRFGTQAQSDITPTVVESSAPPTSSPEKPLAISTTPQDTPRKPGELAPSQIVKIEPQEDGQSSIDHIPKSPPNKNNPLPPEATSRASYAAGDTSNSSKSSAEDAPLPPDFLPSRNKANDSQLVPPEYLVPLEDKEDDRLDDDEGSGVDVAQELSPLTDPTQSPKISPESSFGALVDKSPLNERFTQVQRHHQPRQGTKALFGEIGSKSLGYPYLPPASKVQESSRSPSPVRGLSTAELLRPDPARSVSAPGRPTKAIAARRQALSKMTKEGPPQPSQHEMRNQERDLRLSRQAQKEAEEEQDLSDREDEKVREELAAEVEPRKDLEPFLAHQDYVGKISKAGIPGQIEAVYRDINSMIDTLGLNSRSLKAFVMWHNEIHKAGGRSLEDLESPDWSMSEIEDLESLERRLFQKLEDGRVYDVQGKLTVCREMRKELHKVRSKRQEITKAIGATSDASKSEVLKSTPLDLHQSMIQHDLRRDFSRVQKLLVEAEEAISMLRVTLASQEKSNGRTSAVKKPTVEAVTNTINKMTSMIEKKNLDIDVLEVHMGRLGFSPGPHEGNRETSVPVSPYSKKSPGRRNPDPNSSYLFTPENSHRLNSSAGTPGSAALRKGMNNVTNEEIDRYRTSFQHRKAVAAIIKTVFMKSGPRVREFID